MAAEHNKNLTLTDWLAIERTHLANERTFLSYFRTSFVFLATGLTIIKVDYFFEMLWVGWLFVGIFPLLLAFGVYRLFKVKSNIAKYYS